MDSGYPNFDRAAIASQIFLMGGSGFIGTRIATLLAGSRLPFQIGDLRPSRTFPERWAECDVRRGDTFAGLLRDTSAIINLAAVHHDDVRPLSLYRETNVDGAAQVCITARGAGVQTIVFTSSVSVYGYQRRPVDESGPFHPFNEYGKTKLEAERIYRKWAGEDSSRSLVIVRPTVVFGETNRGNVYNLLHHIASGRFLMVGDGKNIKSMAYVGNVAAFLLHTLSLGPGVHTFNYVDGPDMNTSRLVETARRAMNKTGSVPRIPMAAALVCGYFFDAIARVAKRRFPISAVRVRKFCENTQFYAHRVAETGFVAPHSLSDGLERTICAEFPDLAGPENRP